MFWQILLLLVHLIHTLFESNNNSYFIWVKLCGIAFLNSLTLTLGHWHWQQTLKTLSKRYYINIYLIAPSPSFLKLLWYLKPKAAHSCQIALYHSPWVTEHSRFVVWGCSNNSGLSPPIRIGALFLSSFQTPCLLMKYTKKTLQFL